MIKKEYATGECPGLRHALLRPGGRPNFSPLFSAEFLAGDGETEPVLVRTAVSNAGEAWNSLLGLRDRSVFVRHVDGQIRDLLAEAVEEHS